MNQKQEEIVRVEEVSFFYEDFPAVKDVNLSIYRGDFLAIIGPNGSGKTTLLKIIVGLLKPQKGRVYLFGQALEEFSDWHKVGYIQQKATHFDPIFPISVEEVIACSLRSSQKVGRRAKDQSKEKIEKILKLVGLEKEIKKPITKLSGGQQQRVLIARALATEPEILLLDEPTTGVDYMTQESFYDLLGQLNQEHQLTIVLVTHDYGIVNKHVNKVACLNQKLIYHGEHSEFCQSAVVQELLSGGHHLVSHRH
ncbi:MAG: metal ABC transporter ATP-binding protein [Candidatus Aminicenantes bacterium]|nr:metal ABC transporter ATP-binding protein [Candidatus Aminicenantes bacterium]